MGAVPVIVRTIPNKLGGERDPSRQIAASVESPVPPQNLFNALRHQVWTPFDIGRDGKR